LLFDYGVSFLSHQGCQMKSKFGLICGVFYLVPSFISPVLAEDKSPITLDQLRSRPVDITVEECRVEVTPPDQPSAGFLPGASSLLPVPSTFLTTLLPPLFEAGFDAVGAGLVDLSGYNSQYKYMSGVANESFYVKSASGYTQGFCFVNVRIDGNAFAAKSQGKIVWKNRNLFEARLAIVPSPDMKAYYVKPLWVRYPKFIINPRAEGVAIELKFLSASGAPIDKTFSHTHFLPVGKEICGKPGSRLLASIDGKPISEDDRIINCSSNVSSVWNILPPAPEVNQALPAQKAVPVVIQANVWEIAGFDPFLNTLGSIIKTNKNKLSADALSTLPPWIYAPNYANMATSAQARVDYYEARQVFLQLVRANSGGAKNCSALLNAWADLVKKSAAAKIQDDVINAMPNCQP
jgi:hypothetical protein